MIEKRNHFIDVLKGMCIILVVITHFPWSESERLHMLFPFWIDMAVPVFMIISGYVYALSYKKKAMDSLESSLSRKNTERAILRYTIPFVIIFVIEVVCSFAKGTLSFSPKTIFSIGIAFLTGGMGPGGYYYPIMIQFIFVFPFVYFTVKRYEWKGVFICGLFNALYELLQRAYGMSESCYRLLLFRYILLISVGCYFTLADGVGQKKKWAFIAMPIGILFILAVRYWGYSPAIITYWSGTSFVSCLYIIPIAVFLIKKCSGVKFAPLELFGKASYNIFLIQMLWYSFFSDDVGALVHHRGLHLGINVLACLGLGVLFYYIEQPMTKRVLSAIKRK